MMNIYKKICPLLLLAFSGLAFEGINTSLNYTAEAVSLFNTGNNDQQILTLDNLNIQFELSSEDLGLWSGGSALIYFLSNSGADISSHLGDVQVSSNIEANTSQRLYEFWFNQVLFKGKVEYLVGWHDLNSEFYLNDCAGLFNNSSFGIGADIAGNVPVSIFNLAALGTRLKYQHSPSLTLQMAIYDGDPGDPDHDKGLHLDWDNDQGLMNIAELQFVKKTEGGTTKSTYRVGSWYHSADITLGNSGDGETFSGNYGMYLSIDQPFNQNIIGFVQGGLAPADRSTIPMYLGCGVNIQSFMQSRPDDLLGFGLAAAKIEAENAWEVSIEALWSIQITEWFNLKPDLQYVINPSATGVSENILQIGLRSEMSIR